MQNDLTRTHTGFWHILPRFFDSPTRGETGRTHRAARTVNIQVLKIAAGAADPLLERFVVILHRVRKTPRPLREGVSAAVPPAVRHGLERLPDKSDPLVQAAVIELGMLMRDSDYAGTSSLEDVRALAEADRDGFLDVVDFL